MRDLRVYVVAALTFALGGCEAIGAIFRVGVWAGGLMVLVVLGLVWFLAAKLR